MPELESLVCCGAAADGKVSCETLSDAATTSQPPPPPADPGLPADSFTIPIGDDVDWTDINAVYDRDDSTKGNTNPKSQHSAAGGGGGGQLKQSRSGSQRFSGVLTPKAPIIGLPNKVQHSGFIGSSRRLPRARIFPKTRPAATNAGGGRAVAPEWEPASPKVSCIGKVLSQKERSRQRQAEGKRRWSAGFLAGFAGLFRCGCGSFKRSEESLESGRPAIAPARRAEVDVAPPAWTAEVDVAPPPPEDVAPPAAGGLGGMKRFASRRRAASWAGDVEEEPEGHVARLGGGEEVWARRSVGSLEDMVRV